MSITSIARPEIRALRGYAVPAASVGALRLNANEAPQATGNGTAEGLNRYPAPRPRELTAKLAEFYGVALENLLVTRGSSEGIDLLIRVFCRDGKDSVLVTPPAFDLYQVYASVQGARTIEVPLQADYDFDLDVEAMLAACEDSTKIIFLCSPNNPFGPLIPSEKVLQIVRARAGKSIVVVDEAYVEFSDVESFASRVSEFDNLVVLRSLSKALALAGARCGAVVAAPDVIRLLDSILAPYAVSAPVIASAESAMSPSRLTEAQNLINTTVAERERLRDQLGTCGAVKYVWPSDANFLLVQFRDLGAVMRGLDDAGIVIRAYDDVETLRGCARITIGAPADNNRLVASIRGLG